MMGQRQWRIAKACASGVSLVLFACAALAAQQPPVQMTSEQDHQRTMGLLHVTSLRPGADGNNPNEPNAANYEESKANPYPDLPDPLILKNGKKVTTAKMWWKQRRPEIVEDFDREVYGRLPKNIPRVKWEIVSTNKEMNGDVPVVTKKLVGRVDNTSFPPVSVDIQLTLTIPADMKGPVPVMMEFGLSPEIMAALAKRFPAAQAASGPTWQQHVLARGWGYAFYIPTSVQPDNGAGLTHGIIGLVNKGQPRKLDDWGALRAWAWGASRALDYFETDKSVDAKKVGIEGHSRYGKAALIAMAYDPRFAIAYISSSGKAGADLYRRNFGELVENVAATNEYHWMAGNFLQYAGPLTPSDLPVDSHELIALCAPRPVFIGAGATKGDGWVDAKGMFMAAAGANPVYELLGKKGLSSAEFPPIETALINGDLAFRQHSEGHTPAPNWPTFLTFASRYFTGPAQGAQRESGGKVALTFDDLPVHGALPPGLSRVGIAESIIHTLQSFHAPPAYGFVNAKRLEGEPQGEQVLKLWRAAGFPLGNHTFSHMDLDANSVEAFERDVLADEPILRAFMDNQDWRWIRFPYLNEGDTPDKHRGIREFLEQYAYRVAEVTLSFGDYAYNDPYSRCLAKHDSQTIRSMQASYLARATDELTRGTRISEQLYGRDINHIMLLHLGSFDALMLSQLLALLKQSGFSLISLEEAESDPAYTIDPELSAHWDGTFLEQMAAARHIPQLQSNEKSLEEIDALCR